MQFRQGDHVHLGHGAYARREVEPACQISELPPLDLCVLSHHHGDHFDDVAARELRKDLPIITNPTTTPSSSSLSKASPKATL